MAQSTGWDLRMKNKRRMNAGVLVNGASQCWSLSFFWSGDSTHGWREGVWAMKKRNKTHRYGQTSAWSHNRGCCWSFFDPHTSKRESWSFSQNMPCSISAHRWHYFNFTRSPRQPFHFYWWGRSLIGKALRWQRIECGFESHRLHFCAVNIQRKRSSFQFQTRDTPRFRSFCWAFDSTHSLNNQSRWSVGVGPSSHVSWTNERWKSWGWGCNEEKSQGANSSWSQGVLLELAIHVNELAHQSHLV